MSRLNKVLLVAVLILLIVLAFIVWEPDFIASFNKPSYYAVYLTSGDLYFGTMPWWNSHVLSDVHLIQKDQTSADKEPRLSLVKFADMVWGPTGDLKLNEKNILWTSKLSEDSQVVKLINAKQ